ncbi:hypothetical protein KAW50_00735 [candidate division WOR-3 bacterium]|nr:hypothetical protein [candidate division WOR-3 bacterium]
MGIFIFFVLLAEPSDSFIQGRLNHSLQPDESSVGKKYSGQTHRSAPTADRWISRDKFHHFSYSLGLTGLSYHIYHCQFNNPNPEARYFSISLTAVAGISKELYDKFYKKSIFSYKDLVWDAVGITVGSLLFLR